MLGCMSTTIRVEPETHESILRLARDDYGGVTADEALRLLVIEHRQRRAIEAWDRFREERPDEWQQYVAESDEMDRSAALPIDGGW